MGAELEFNSIQFEKRLSGLKDSQDGINAACMWCLEHKQFHKKIVATWLSVLKRVKVEQRLTLFYLANDVIQYSKRKNFDFVESWGTALQKATTLVRDAKVKNKILRIFKIWEQRGVYGEEFITDLSGLISVSPSAKKVDESHEFQSSHLVSKIRVCAKLETETDKKLQVFKQHNPNLQDGEALMNSLKDRAHVDDVVKEMDDYVNHMEGYIEALKMEIKARNSLINLLNTADTQLEKDRKDVKIVAVAYKSFATRVKNLRKKLGEKRATLSSPIPSPDVNAPSPSPDSDLELPDNNAASGASAAGAAHADAYANANAGYYNPSAPAAETTTTFMSNMNNSGFSSFIGTGMTFSLSSGDAKQSLTSLFPAIADPPPPPAPAPVPAPNAPADYGSYSSNQMPLAPPPLPPFTNEAYSDYGNSYGNGPYSDQTAIADPYQYNSAAYAPHGAGEYNPEEEVESWENSEWDGPPPAGGDTPASPPASAKEPFLPPIEYHEGRSVPGAVDVDHRLVLDKQDIDHRNLISLTSSPKEAPPQEPRDWHEHGFARRGKDYRAPRPHNADNNESIDMDLSDDDGGGGGAGGGGGGTGGGGGGGLLDQLPPPKKGLLPPPPFPIDLEAYDNDAGLEDEPPPPWQRAGGAPPDRWMSGPPPPAGGAHGASLLGTPMTMVDAPMRGRGRGVHAHHRPPRQANGGRGEFNNRSDFRDGARGRFRPQGAPPKFGAGGGGGGSGNGGWGAPHAPPPLMTLNRGGGGGGMRGGRTFGGRFRY